MSRGDRFEPHNLAADEVEALRRDLAGYDGVETAYLVRKAISHLAERPFYVLAIVPRRHVFQLDAAEDDAKLRQQLEQNVTLPGEGTLLFLLGAERRHLKALRAVPAAEIYSRSGSSRRGYEAVGDDRDTHQSIERRSSY